MVCTLTYCKRPLVQYVWFPGLGKGPLSKATPIKEKYYVKKSYVIFFLGNMFLPSSQNPYLYFSWVKMIDAYQTGNMFFSFLGPLFNHRFLWVQPQGTTSKDVTYRLWKLSIILVKSPLWFIK
jgi:hypothetical protein